MSSIAQAYNPKPAMTRSRVKNFLFKVAVLLVAAMSGVAISVTPAAAASAPDNCWAVTDTSSNYEYRCEFGMFPLADTPAGGAVKRAVFQVAITNFSDYFPFGGCGDELEVGQECDLQPGDSPVEVTEIGSNYFILKSLPGHLEGKDRYIKFAIYIIDNELRLGVRAWGKPSFAAKQSVDSELVDVLWGMYAENLVKIVFP